MSHPKSDNNTPADTTAGLSRRRFIASTGAALAGAVVPYSQSAAANSNSWEGEADVVIVGCGPAGAAAALFADKAGAESVLMLEKGPVFGGTAIKAEGGFWVPNNRWMRARGLADNRQEGLEYMARIAFPSDYAPNAEFMGLLESDFRLLEAIFDHSASTIEQLHDMGAINVGLPELPNGELITDYFDHLPENRAGRGRTLMSIHKTGDYAGYPGNGAEMSRQLRMAIDASNIEMRFRHQVNALIVNSAGEIVGVEVTDRRNQKLSVRARRGVVFASGGFTHNAEYRDRFLRGPTYGGCAVATNTGDFLKISMDIGASLGNLGNAWGSQLPLEIGLDGLSPPTGIWGTPGDSAIQVNRFGKRFFNEKFVYAERTKAHFRYNPMQGEFDHRISVHLFDERSRQAFAGSYPIPPAGIDASYMITADTLSELVDAVNDRLSDLASRTAGFRLSTDFLPNLEQTIQQFNSFAESGRDQKFQRGTLEIEHVFHSMFLGATHQGEASYRNPMPNQTMYPISDKGPYYAVLLAAGTLDTKGGPRIDVSGAVLRPNGERIPGLYGAGNCVSHPSGDGYWGPGATIGPAFVMGRLAGESAAGSPVKELDINA